MNSFWSFVMLSSRDCCTEFIAGLHQGLLLGLLQWFFLIYFRDSFTVDSQHCIRFQDSFWLSGRREIPEGLPLNHFKDSFRNFFHDVIIGFSPLESDPNVPWDFSRDSFMITPWIQAFLPGFMDSSRIVSEIFPRILLSGIALCIAFGINSGFFFSGDLFEDCFEDFLWIFHYFLFPSLGISSSIHSGIFRDDSSRNPVGNPS